MASPPVSLPGGTGVTTPAPSGADPAAPTPRPDIAGVPIASLKFRKIWVLFANTESGTPEVHRGHIQRLDKRSGGYSVRFADGDQVILPLSGDQAPLWGMGDPPALCDLVLSPDSVRIARASRHAHDDLGSPSGSTDLPASASVSSALSAPVFVPVVERSSVATPSASSGAVFSASASAGLSAPTRPLAPPSPPALRL